ncbi:hypothetical protein C6501_16795 [Candidatus Poribacteria bacterium]|nr:MAG: hypothetical protein C6501_16795 [Candidatus Poribacteria bacterium]
MQGTKQCSTTISARCYLSYIAIAVLLFSSSLIGCQRRVWENSLDSPDQIGLAVVDALNQKDIEKLNELRVQRKEYLSWIYPAFPKSNFPPDFAWSNLNKKCYIGIKRWIDRYGGLNLNFVKIRFDKPTESYKGFQLLRGTVLTLKNPAGQELDLKILGSVVLKDNRYKLLSYDDG